MAPIVKDVENSAATSAPAAPATKPPQDSSATRPQPVALEVPVTVNGARTVEGSDKREPFSESTKTVLVFGNGAVIRLASLVAPGQLLFVTNEKSKKEVVCQVVKSKNYRTVTGYVELEFTEPVAGFWGMRFPAERTTPAPATSAPAVVPVPPTPGKPPVASVAPSTPAPPKAVAPPPPPTVVKPTAPTAVPLKPLASAPPVPKPVAPVERNAPAPIAKPPLSATPAAHGIPPQPVVPTPPVSVKPESTPLPEVVPAPVAPALEASSQVEIKSVPPEIAKSGPTTTPPSSTTEDLKQHAARLQEQLSSLLFTEAPASKQPELVVTPKQDMIPTETVQKILQLTQPDVKPPALAVVPVQESRPAPAAPKPAPVSMAVEEVKIPAWLAPLARETDATSTEAVAELVAVSEANSSSKTIQEAALTANADLSSSKVEHPMFGGQLLGTSPASSKAHTSGGSKTGLWIGIAATVLLVAGGGAWYVTPSGTTQTASKSASTQTAQNSNAASSQPAFRSESDAPSGKTATSPGQPTTAKPLTPAPIPAVNSAVNSAPVPAVVKETTSAPRNAPPAEQPKKSVLGDVRLATPNVNRAANSPEGSEGAPSIDAGQPSSSEPLVSLAGSHSKEPTAPLRIGGDVQPAKLLKSVPPIYPPTARTQRVAGDVKIDALIDASGNVSSMKVISGPTLLHQAAMTALKQWKFEPAKLDGNPTQMHLTVTVQFRLQ